MIGLYTGYVILKDRQLNGHYLPTYIYVQLGDANYKIPYYSGILSSGNVRATGYREYRDLSTESMMLAYCGEENAWTFSHGNDPCDYFAKSYGTENFDVTTIHDSHWQVVDSISRLQPFTSVSLVRHDCNPKTCQGTCNAAGLCQCSHDQFGIDCEFSNVCPQLVVDEKLQPFLPITLFPEYLMAVSDSFALLMNPSTEEYVKAYNMPVYYSNKTFPANIIFFGGRRWIIASEWDLINLPGAKRKNPDMWFFPNETVSRFENSFHAFHQANYTPLYISDPVDFETPNFLPTPAGLRWWHAKIVNETSKLYAPGAPMGTQLTCMVPPVSCVGQPEDFCRFGGFCNSDTGLCQCGDDYYGDRCELEIACYDQINKCNGNGSCDKSTGACRCNIPYFGKLCSERYKCYEVGGKCKNGGVCDMTTGECGCPGDDPAINGEACEKRDDCFYFGCQNGGYCGQNGKCHCQPPFYGALCDLVDKTQTDLFCSNEEDCTNGICNTDGICDCEDPSNYGTLCEHQFNCSKVFSGQPSCLNSGICDKSTGVCECPEPYFGPDCSQLRLCMDDSDCSNSQSDICNVETGKCLCSGGPSAGKLCEKTIWCSSDDDCHYGFCGREYNLCEYPRGHSGWFCQTWAVDGTDEMYWDQKYKDETEDIARCGFENIGSECMPIGSP